MATVVNVIKQNKTEWHSVDWQKTNRIVKNLRQRIFKATRNEDWKTVRNLQRLLMKSYSNILLKRQPLLQLQETVDRERTSFGADIQCVPTQRILANFWTDT